MTPNIQGIVALCAGAGFLIVWLVLPAKETRTSFNGDEAASNSLPPEDEPKAESAQEEPSKDQSTDSGSRPRWCDILLLEPDASPASIRKAYARLMKGLHPDVAATDANTVRRCALVQEAYRQAMQDRGTRA